MIMRLMPYQVHKGSHFHFMNCLTDLKIKWQVPWQRLHADIPGLLYDETVYSVTF